MKKCTYCGRECEEDAINCSGCGQNEFEDPSHPPTQAGNEDELVTLTTCQKPEEADLIRSRLDAAGIEAFILDEKMLQDAGFTLDAFGSVRVQVHPKDYAGARELLAALELPSATDPAPAPVPPPPAEDGKRVIFSMAAGQGSELLAQLEKAGILFKVKTATEANGLEMSEILVAEADYDRGCDLVEAWSDEKQAEYEKKHAPLCQKCGGRNTQRIPHETLGSIYKCKDCGYEFAY